MVWKSSFLMKYRLQLAEAIQRAGLPLLINLPAGDLMTGGAGLACVPQRQAEFDAALQAPLTYAAMTRPLKVTYWPADCCRVWLKDRLGNVWSVICAPPRRCSVRWVFRCCAKQSIHWICRDFCSTRAANDDLHAKEALDKT